MADEIPDLTDEEIADLHALGQTIDILGELFQEGGSLPALRMAAAAAIRRAADVLDGFADRWEAA